MLKTDNRTARVFLNRFSNHGKSLLQWKMIEGAISDRMGKFETEEIHDPDDILVKVSKYIDSGERIFIAAGGDGTVNLLLNGIMNATENPEIIIGAIGLGSSNDFHKPFCKDTFVEGVPAKIDHKNSIPYDVIRVAYQNLRGNKVTHFCLINASIGLTAEANAFFNMHTPFMGMLQKMSVNSAILYAALRTIATYRNKPCQLRVDDCGTKDLIVTNLGIIKNPHFTGTLCYDTAIEPDDGRLGVNLCMDMSLGEKIRTLVALSNRKFQGRPKTRTWMATRISVESEEYFALEMDGEVVRTNCAKFTIMPKRVRCCR